MLAAMLVLVGGWALAEAVLFFIVADVPIMAVALRFGVRRAVVAALLAALFAMLGGLVTMYWAANDPDGSRAMIEALPGISPALFDEAAQGYAASGWRAMLVGAFSGVPYKLYAHAAGASGAGIAAFALASVAARLPRFLIVGALSGWLGPWLQQRIGARAMWALFAAGWAVFYAWYFSVM